MEKEPIALKSLACPTCSNAELAPRLDQAYMRHTTRITAKGGVGFVVQMIGRDEFYCRVLRGPVRRTGVCDVHSAVADHDPKP